MPSIVHSNSGLGMEVDVSTTTAVSEKVHKILLSEIKRETKKDKLEKEFYKEFSKNLQKENKALRNKIEKDAIVTKDKDETIDCAFSHNDEMKNEVIEKGRVVGA